MSFINDNDNSKTFTDLFRKSYVLHKTTVMRYLCMFPNYERREGSCSAQLCKEPEKSLGSRNSAPISKRDGAAKTNPKPVALP